MGGVTTWPEVIIAVGSYLRVSDAPSIRPVMPIMGLTGASTFFYIHGHTWPSKLPAKQDCWFIDLWFLSSVSFPPHPNVGGRATRSVLLDDRLDRTVRAQAGILCDSWFNQEQEVLDDQSNQWKQPAAVMDDNESRSGDAPECLFMGS